MVETGRGFLACRHKKAVVMWVSHGGRVLHNGWQVWNGYYEKVGVGWGRSRGSDMLRIVEIVSISRQSLCVS